MCGICGWYGRTESIESEITLKRMCDKIVHRGPDNEGIFVGRAAALGIRRLSIIDLKTGSQPIHNEDKTIWVVCNGEVYNFKYLRAELEKKGHKFYTNSDVEVIVHLYEEKGFDAVSSLRGMFAFAIYDEKKGLIFIARDRIGKKPLVYTVLNGRLLFASEIKSLLEFPGIQREVNREAIDLYLTYQYVPSPLTAFKDIHKLPPAHYMVYDSSGKLTLERYWQPTFEPKKILSEQEWQDAVIDKLREATRIRMISDVPLGAFLSGGIDSSAVVAMMAMESSKPVKTFAIGFEEEEYSELKYASAVAKHLGTDHHEYIVRPNAAEILPKLAWFYDEPFADSSALPSYYVARETRREVTVALNGDGGDENFAGYLRYRAFKLSEQIAPVRGLLWASLPAIKKLLPYTDGKARKLLHRARTGISALCDSPAQRNIRWHSIFNNETKDKMYSQGMKSFLAGKNSYSYMEQIFLNAPVKNDIDRLLYTDLMAYLPGCLLVKVDIASMANSLEARSPFLDHELIELAAQMPDTLKLKGYTSKYILKKALKNVLPDDILSRKKMGFGIPIHRWFRGELKDYLKDIILSPKSLGRGYFNKDYIETILCEHEKGQNEHGYRLWALMMLELWHRNYID